MRVRPCGDAAVLLDCDSPAEARAWFAAFDGQHEAVLGARTVLLRGEPARLRAMLEGAAPVTGAVAAAGPTVEIAVRYDGPDLADVARLTGLSESEVVAAHTGTPWVVAFGGFAPGFFYLVGGDPRLQVPRRESPRPRVPAGAVGLAGEFSGVYPRASPGGWRLLGTTDAVLWDSDRAEPALLSPGASVRFAEAP